MVITKVSTYNMYNKNIAKWGVMVNTFTLYQTILFQINAARFSFLLINIYHKNIKQHNCFKHR